MPVLRTPERSLSIPLDRRRFLKGSAGAALAALAGYSAAGCARQRPIIGPSPGDADFETAGRGTIQFWARSDVAAVSQEMVRRFHQAQSEVRVELTLIPGTQLVTKLATAIRGDSQPDLFGFDDFFGIALAYYGALTDLTEPISRLPYADALSPSMVATLQLNDRVYGVPYDSDLSALWINKRLFAQAGLDPAQPPATLNDLAAAAEAITRSGAGAGLALPGTCGPCLSWVISPSIWAGGDRFIQGEPGDQRANFADNASLRSVLEIYASAWSAGAVTPGSRTQNGSTWATDFRAGQVGIFPGGYSTLVGQIPDAELENFTLVPLPGPEGGRATFTGGDNLAIPAGATNPSAAWKLMQFILAEEQQLALPELGFTPIRTDVLTDDYRAKYPINAVLLELQADGGYIERSAAANTIFSQSSGAFPTAFAQSVFGGDIQVALRDAQEQAQAALNEVNAR